MFRAPDSGGLRCSKDGGKGWSTCGQGLPQTEPVSQFIFDNTQKEQVWTRTADGNLWRSTDSGRNFSNASLPSGSASTFMTSPSDSSARLAFDGHTLWRNETGTDWRRASSWSPDETVVTMAARERSDGLLLAIMKNGSLLRSQDEGETFVPIADVPWPTENPPSGVVFHPTRDGLAIAYGGDHLYRSLDNGQTWRSIPLQVPSDNTRPVEVQNVAFDPTVRQMHLVTTNHGVLASHDLGRTWAPSSVGIDRGASVGTVAIAPDGRAIMGSSNSGVIYSLEAVANREFVFSKVFFASGAMRPNRSLLPHLDDVARNMRKNRTAHMHVEGHADSVGSATLNDKVSRGRAQWVVDYLAKKGVPPTQMSIAWYGEGRPLFDNDSSKGRSKNRRVEMVLVGEHKKIPSLKGMQ
jgi:outer membrane protein OmpA-like peptidoglycan-associated protein